MSAITAIASLKLECLTIYYVPITYAYQTITGMEHSCSVKHEIKIISLDHTSKLTGNSYKFKGFKTVPVSLAKKQDGKI